MDVELVLDESIAPGIEDVAGPVASNENRKMGKKGCELQKYNDSSSLHYMHAGTIYAAARSSPSSLQPSMHVGALAGRNTIKSDVTTHSAAGAVSVS